MAKTAATKSSAKKTTAVVPARAALPELPSDWESQLEQYAKQSRSVQESTVSGSWLTFKGGVLQYKQQPLKGNSTELVVLAAVLENLYYDKDFDPDQPASPICFAFHHDKAQMAPHDAAPQKQSPTCASCKWNKFGSAMRGNGKACKNSLRLVALAWGNGELEDISEGDLAFAKLPVTSVRNYTDYISKLPDKLGVLPAKFLPFMAVTTLSVVPDPKSQFQVKFALHEKLPRELWGAAWARVEEANRQLVPADPYPSMQDEDKGKDGNDRKARGGKEPQQKPQRSRKY